MLLLLIILVVGCWFLVWAGDTVAIPAEVPAVGRDRSGDNIIDSLYLLPAWIIPLKVKDCCVRSPASASWHSRSCVAPQGG